MREESLFAEELLLEVEDVRSVARLAPQVLFTELLLRPAALLIDADNLYEVGSSFGLDVKVDIHAEDGAGEGRRRVLLSGGIHMKSIQRQRGAAKYERRDGGAGQKQQQQQTERRGEEERHQLTLKLNGKKKVELVDVFSKSDYYTPISYIL